MDFKIRHLLKALSHGYFAGENVNNEIKEAWVKGALYGIKNCKELTYTPSITERQAEWEEEMEWDVQRKILNRNTIIPESTTKHSDGDDDDGLSHYMRQYKRKNNDIRDDSDDVDRRRIHGQSSDIDEGDKMRYNWPF